MLSRGRPAPRTVLNAANGESETLKDVRYIKIRSIQELCAAETLQICAEQSPSMR